MSAPTSSAFDELRRVIDQLRTHCAWTAALDHQSLRHYLIEESYEFIDALSGGRREAIIEELGDVLLQVVLHARIGQESHGFDLDDVARALTEKMVRRNTHIFAADGTLRENPPQSVEAIIASWDAAKAAEKGADDVGSKPVLEGLPAALPALLLGQKFVHRRSKKTQLQLPDATARQALATAAAVQDEAQLSALLLALCERAEQLGLDAENALRDAVHAAAEVTTSRDGSHSG